MLEFVELHTLKNEPVFININSVFSVSPKEDGGCMIEGNTCFAEVSEDYLTVKRLIERFLGKSN